jgi:superfamily I DNA and RNA helicase
MALVINDRVKENSTTSGTGNITLAGVASGQGNEAGFALAMAVAL